MSHAPVRSLSRVPITGTCQTLHHWRSNPRYHPRANVACHAATWIAASRSTTHACVVNLSVGLAPYDNRDGRSQLSLCGQTSELSHEPNRRSRCPCRRQIMPTPSNRRADWASGDSSRHRAYRSMLPSSVRPLVHNSNWSRDCSCKCWRSGVHPATSNQNSG